VKERTFQKEAHRPNGGEGRPAERKDWVSPKESETTSGLPGETPAMFSEPTSRLITLKAEGTVLSTREGSVHISTGKEREWAKIKEKKIETFPKKGEDPKEEFGVLSISQKGNTLSSPNSTAREEGG